MDFKRLLPIEDDSINITLLTSENERLTVTNRTLSVLYEKERIDKENLKTLNLKIGQNAAAQKKKLQNLCERLGIDYTSLGS